jgi:hypothetical protein
MRTRTLILLILLVPLSGCIVTYRDFPNATLESLPKGHELKPLYYHVEPIVTKERAEEPESNQVSGRMTAFLFTLSPTLYPAPPQMDPIGQPGYHEVALTLKASGMFSDLIEPQTAPDTGVYCYVNFEVRERPAWLDKYAAVQNVLLHIPIIQLAVVAGVFPYYVGEGGTTVVYTLYRDGRLKSAYRYPITKKGGGWIVLLPFAWLNFFTNDLKDAVRGTTLQFLIDAQHDGNL